MSDIRKKRLTTVDLCTMALFIALLSVSAYISVPLPLPGAPKLTLLNFVILLIALIFPIDQSFLIILGWMLLGLMGIPVFIGGRSGIGYLLAPWGGYTVSYPLVALLLPLLRGKQWNRLRYTIVAVIGALFIDLFGMVWLKLMSVDAYPTWTSAFFAGVVVFLPLDMVKCFIAAQIIPVIRRVLPKAMR